MKRLSMPILPMLVLAIFGLLAAMWAGLLRLGWDWPVLRPTLPMAHGPLMIIGFLGTVIGLERAVGLGKRWMLGAPILTATSALLLVFGVGGNFAVLLSTVASLWLCVVLVQLLRIQIAPFSLTIVAGGVALLIGNLLWLRGWLIPQLLLWWIAFLILTVVGERLELSRVVRLGRVAYAIFALGIGLLVIALFATFWSYSSAMQLFGASTLVLSLWLFIYDVARRRVKVGGQARFVALSLLSGYAWLGIAGILALWHGGVMAGPIYDAILHAIFLGFVITMIFAHAPIIFPALLQVQMIFSPRFYSHLILLHASLALRVVGDLLPWWNGRLWGGLLNVLVILLFLFNTITAIKPRFISSAPRSN